MDEGKAGSLPEEEATDPVADRIRQRRIDSGWSLADLAERAGLRAPSHVYYIETSEKAPSEEVAQRLAEALGEDEELFRAWARLRSRSDLWTSLSAARTLEEWLENERSLPSAEIGSGPSSNLVRSPVWFFRDVPAKPRSAYFDPRQAGEAATAPRSPETDPRRSAAVSEAPIPPIPLMPQGTDPDRVDQESASVRWLRPRPESFDARREIFANASRLEAPFAYDLSWGGQAKIRVALPAGHVAILSREVLPIEEAQPYAVRVADRIELGYVRWDGRRLLLLPSPGKADFEVFPARSEGELRRYLAGKVAVVCSKAEVEVTGESTGSHEPSVWGRVAASLGRRWPAGLDLDEGEDDLLMIFEALNARGTTLRPWDLVRSRIVSGAESQGLDVARFHRLDVMGATAAGPVLLWMLGRKGVPLGEMDRGLHAIESWLVRRMLTKKNTRAYDWVIQDMRKALGAAEPARAGQAVVDFLRSRERSSDHWPDDQELMKHMMSTPCWSRIEERQLQMVFCALEEELTGSRVSEEQQLTETIHIEKILPREWADHWPLPGNRPMDVERRKRDEAKDLIGNLTILSGPLSSKLSNGPWSEKRKAISQFSTLRLNRELVLHHPDRWDEAAIRRRGQRLAELASRVWPPPGSSRWDG